MIDEKEGIIMDNLQNSAVDTVMQPNTQQYNQQIPPNNRPVGQLKTNRSVIVTILLSFITFGIYSLIMFCGISNDVNIVASRYDGRQTMHFALLAFLVSPITLGIGAIVWYHNISKRIGHELHRRNIAYSFNAGSFWLWNVLGTLIVIGPIIYMYKLFKAMNLICRDYNYNG